MSDPTIKLEVDQRAADYITDQVDQLADTIQQDEDAKAQVAKEEQQTEEQALAINKNGVKIQWTIHKAPASIPILSN